MVIHPVAVLLVAVGDLLLVVLRRQAVVAAGMALRPAVATVHPVAAHPVVVGVHLLVPVPAARQVMAHPVVHHLVPVLVVRVTVLPRAHPVAVTCRPVLLRAAACRPATFRRVCRRPRLVMDHLAVQLRVVQLPAVQELAVTVLLAAVTVRPVRSRPPAAGMGPLGTGLPAAVARLVVLVVPPAVTAARPEASCRLVAAAARRGRRWRR